MQTEKLIFKYNGEALVKHQIDLGILSESLQGVNSLLNEVNLALNGTRDNLTVKVEPFHGGSFEIIIDVIQNPGEYVELLSIIGLSLTAGPASLISIIKRLKGRQIKKLSFTQSGDCKVILEDEVFEVPSYYRPLLASPSVRKSLSKLAHNPLQYDGIDSFSVIRQDGGEELFHVNRDDAPSFRYRRVPVEDTFIHKVINDATISFLTMHKDKSSSWRIDYDGETYNTSIKDDDFISRVIGGHEPKLFSSAYRVDLLVKEDLISLDKTYIVAKVHDTVD